MSRFNKVHVICERLRGKPCKRCQAWENDVYYGLCQRACYGLAQEVINIAVHGNPWGRKAKSSAVKEWRDRVAEHGEC